jgi:RNA polymerase sigma-70 factor (ECF subfamily)
MGNFLWEKGWCLRLFEALVCCGLVRRHPGSVSHRANTTTFPKKHFNSGGAPGMILLIPHAAEESLYRKAISGSGVAPMPDEAVNTLQLNAWVERIRAGDLSARDELLRAVGNRLERLARKMLGRFPNVHRWADTGDVLQNALLRLLRALEQVQPHSVRDFFGLAAEQMRRELLDLARHFHGPHGLAAHHESGVLASTDRTPPLDPPERTEDAGDLEQWSAFHQGVATLPAEEREIVGLIFYHGWTQADVAQLLGMSVRTVQRRWESALLTLHAAVKGQ